MSKDTTKVINELKEKALQYHSHKQPGKFATRILKPLTSLEHFGLSYTPGVAEPCMAIHENPASAYQFTSKGNVVAVISNGTAVLGLGDIGPLASKPVMEGKAILFKYLAGIDSIDVEIDLKDTNKIVEFIKAMVPTVGGINLEDVAAPECFDIDKAVHYELGIPFFHDDQSGTAVVVIAAVGSALAYNKKKLSDCKIVVSGAGAAALACIDLLVEIGADIKKFHVFDSKGLLHTGRELDRHKRKYAQPSDSSMREALNQADIFLGLSRGNVLSKDDVAQMVDDPILFAMANPIPEILPTDAKEVKPNAIVGSGRSDFVNQVNNVLCFPFLFRGALDVKAKTITLNMQLACAQAIMQVAQSDPEFGKDKVMPYTFDPSLLYIVPKAVAQAAIDDKVAQSRLPDDYNDFLDSLVYGSVIDKSCCIPAIGNDAANQLVKILKAHNITRVSDKKLFALSKEEILDRARDVKSCVVVFEDMDVGFNVESAIMTKDLIKTLATAKNNLLGLILDGELLFDSSNRIWHAHKLSRGKNERAE